MRTADVIKTRLLIATGAATAVTPNRLSIAHGERLLGGELYAPLSRVDGATLSRRTFDIDVKRCTRCGGRMTVRAVVTDSAPIARTRRPVSLALAARRGLTSARPRATRRVSTESCPALDVTRRALQTRAQSRPETPPATEPHRPLPPVRRYLGLLSQASRRATHRPAPTGSCLTPSRDRACPGSWR